MKFLLFSLKKNKIFFVFLLLNLSLGIMKKKIHHKFEKIKEPCHPERNYLHANINTGTKHDGFYVPFKGMLLIGFSQNHEIFEVNYYGFNEDFFIFGMNENNFNAMNKIIPLVHKRLIVNQVKIIPNEVYFYL